MNEETRAHIIPSVARTTSSKIKEEKWVRGVCAAELGNIGSKQMHFMSSNVSGWLYVKFILIHLIWDRVKARDVGFSNVLLFHC